jgi:hypothetical protein
MLPVSTRRSAAVVADSRVTLEAAALIIDRVAGVRRVALVDNTINWDRSTVVATSTCDVAVVCYSVRRPVRAATAHCSA